MGTNACWRWVIEVFGLGRHEPEPADKFDVGRDRSSQVKTGRDRSFSCRGCLSYLELSRPWEAGQLDLSRPEGRSVGNGRERRSAHLNHPPEKGKRMKHERCRTIPSRLPQFVCPSCEPESRRL